jgi:hypothetical protein
MFATEHDKSISSIESIKNINLESSVKNSLRNNRSLKFILEKE